MSAADERMAVRTPSGYRSLPRRAALGMIATGRATAATRPVKAVKSAGLPVRVAQGTVETMATLPGTAVNEATGEVTPAGEPLPEAVSEPHPVGEVVTALADDAGVSEPRGNASRAVWVDYATSVGIVVDDEMTRNDIRDAVKNGADSVRMSQPAREGGRLANPGDEPVTEAVTDAHPGIE